MKILFLGDSITDMGRNREQNSPNCIWSYGSGYPMFVAGKLYDKNPTEYQVINRGNGGNRIVDLYSRIKSDVWNLEPDVLSILIGINDVWHEVCYNNGVDLERFERVYSMLLEDTLKRLPNVKIILCEPFVLKGSATEREYEQFCEVYDYAKVIKNLADKYGLYFLPLQKKFDEMAERYGAEHYLYDGVHPMVAGASLIANEWINLFFDKVLEK